MQTTMPFPPFHDLSPVLHPRSIAVLGASEKRGNLGGVAVGLLRKFGYPGPVWPVHPAGASVHGLSAFTSVADLPEPADLAIFATSAKLTAGLVRECAAAGIRYGVVWAGGYAEVGGNGEALQDELVETCKETGFTIVGPNCIGVINAAQASIASFASFLVESERLSPGRIAMISQSGGLATMAQATAQNAGFGFSCTISSGNEAMLTAADYIHALASDPGTRVIALYLEGVRDGDRFIAAVSAARAAGKPVIVLKGGMTSASAQAAAAHTGAFAGEGRVWTAIASELGLISVKSLEELLDVALFLDRADLDHLPKGTGVAAVSFGGGSGVLSADQCIAHGLEMPPLGAATTAALKPLVPPIASIKNPVDLTPQAFNQEQWFKTFSKALDVIAADPAIDTVLCQMGPQAQRGAEVAEIICDLGRRAGKTVCIAWPLAPRDAREVLSRRDAYVFQEYERALAVIGKLAHLTPPSDRHGRGAAAPFDWDKFIPKPAPHMVISEHECHRILAAAGVATARGHLATSAAEAAEAAQAIGFPIVMKGISPQVTHRAAAGLVALDIRTPEDARATYDRLAQRAEAAKVRLDGIYLQAMIRDGAEVIVSAFRDPIFGTMISCGWGGNFTEIIGDVTIFRAALDEASVKSRLASLRIARAAAKLDHGVNIDDLVRFVTHFARLAASAPWKRFVIEINPVKWSSRGVVAVDGLLIIEEL